MAALPKRKDNLERLSPEFPAAQSQHSSSLIEPQFDVSQSLNRKIDFFTYALILCIGAAIFLTAIPVTNYTGDSNRYLGLADSILAGQGYEFNFRAHTRFPPGLPLLLAGLKYFGASTHQHFIGLMALFAMLSLFVVYHFMKNEGHAVLGAVAVFILASSEAFYVRSSQHIASDLPYFFFSFLGLLLASKIERQSGVVSSLFYGMLFALTLFASLLTRSVGIAMLAALPVWLLFHARAKSRPGKIQFLVLLPAFSLGAAYLIVWKWWQHLNTSVRWPGEFMNSYLAQAVLKDPHRPEAGVVGFVDICSRVWEHALSQTAQAASLVTKLPWIDPKWYSPLVLIPGLLLLSGLLITARRQLRIYDFYFVFYLLLITLWPFDEGARYVFPVFALGLLYIWRGMRWYWKMAEIDPRLFFALAAIGCAVVLCSGGIAYSFGSEMVGRQAMLSLLFWFIAGSACLVFSLCDSERIRAGVNLRTAGKCGLLLLALSAFVGFSQQVSAAKVNISTDLSGIYHSSSVDAANWLKGVLQPTDSIMAGQDAIVHSITKYRVIEFPPVSDTALIKSAIERYNVRYLVVLTNDNYPYFYPSEKERFLKLQHDYPSLGQVVHRTKNYLIFNLTAVKPPV